MSSETLVAEEYNQSFQLRAGLNFFAEGLEGGAKMKLSESYRA